MYDDNIKSLRLCADECEEDCEGCAYYKNGCMPKMMRDAADAIERLQAEVDRKDKAIQSLLTQIERKDKELKAAQEKKPMRIWCTNNQVLEKYEKACAMLEKHEAENADFIVYTSEEAKERVVRMKEKMEKTKGKLIDHICEHGERKDGSAYKTAYKLYQEERNEQQP